MANGLTTEWLVAFNLLPKQFIKGSVVKLGLVNVLKCTAYFYLAFCLAVSLEEPDKLGLAIFFN